MNKEQQIKEMTQDFINFGITTRQGVEAFAEILYNAGYRKISEDNICEAVEKPVDTSKKEYPDIDGIVSGFVKMSNKEQQIDEIEQFIYDYVDSKQTERVYLLSSRVNELAKPFVHNKGLAEALYNAGYRKVPDCAVILTPKERDEEIKACNEKQAELEAEIERLKNDLVDFDEFARGISKTRIEITGEAIPTCKTLLEYIEKEKRNAVKEFAEKLKKKVHNYYPSIDSYCTSKHVILVKDIDELLKEYEQ